MSSQSVSSVLIREEEHQLSIYYVSKALLGVETRYPDMEKLALSLITVSRKLRPYFLAHSIHVLTNFPLSLISSTNPERPSKNKPDAGHEPDTNHGSVNHGPVGTLTRSRAKKIKEDIQGLVKTLWTDADIRNMSLTDEVPTWVHLIQAKEGVEEQFEDKAKLEDPSTYGSRICVGEQNGQLCDRMVIKPCDRNNRVSEAECN
ncbi:Ribonuclease H [Abeliophyllum distichum]|uniref:Ribonuclease H n=1 Tax=Abeliophyllum distichum TaxID=126358 RepID=A0ABD1Q4I5_9LAMI